MYLITETLVPFAQNILRIKQKGRLFEVNIFSYFCMLGGWDGSEQASILTSPSKTPGNERLSFERDRFSSLGTIQSISKSINCSTHVIYNY